MFSCVWVLLLWGIWLTLVNFVVIVLVERVWGAEAIEAVTFFHLGSSLDKGVIIIGVLIRDHVLILIWVLLLWGIWLSLVNFIVIVLVEWVWGAEAIKAVALLHLGSCLDKRVIIVGIHIRDHVLILIWVLLLWC